jgi:hypothetical protein
MLLPSNALRPVANVWMHWSRRQLLEIGKVVSPLRLVAERNPSKLSLCIIASFAGVFSKGVATSEVQRQHCTIPAVSAS